MRNKNLKHYDYVAFTSKIQRSGYLSDDQYDEMNKELHTKKVFTNRWKINISDVLSFFKNKDYYNVEFRSWLDDNELYFKF